MKGVVTMIELLENIYLINNLYDYGVSNIPNEKGIYMVLKPKKMSINILSTTTAIEKYEDKSMIYDAIKLNTKYERTDKTVLYIGKAGDNNKLRGRIRQLVRYGYREVDNHRGGRAIWQIENNKDLLIGYFLCNSPESKEKELLKIYKGQYGVLPLANWKIG